MNNIIPVSRLGELLAAKTGADVDACTKFVKEYFGLIEATLAAGEDVTIKGIGTFRLTGNDEEPVVYEPDADLAATVNAPFEAFDAVDLNDTEFSENIPTPIVETQGAEAEPEVEAEVEPVAIEEQKAVEEPEIIEEPEAEPEVEAEAEPEAELEPEAEPERHHHHHHSSHRYYSSRRNNDYPRGLAIFWMVITFILGLFLGLAVGYFGYRYINKYMTGSVVYEETIYEDDDTDSISDANEITFDEDVEMSGSVDKKLTEAEPAVAQPAQQAEAKAKEPRYDTITSTCFLTTLARKYFGEMDYWVFIYDANNLGNPNVISPGTKVRIPYPEELKLSGNKEADLKVAKQRAAEIYRKYK
jgi:hypothetical protein